MALGSWHPRGGLVICVTLEILAEATGGSGRRREVGGASVGGGRAGGGAVGGTYSLTSPHLVLPTKLWETSTSKTHSRTALGS